MTLQVLLVVAVLATASNAFPQEGTSREDQIAALESRLEEAERRLALTDEQRELVTPIFEEHFRAQFEILQEHGIDLEARIAGRDRRRLGLLKLRALRSDIEDNAKKTEGKLAAVLSEHQLEEFRKIQEEQRAERRELLRPRRNND